MIYPKDFENKIGFSPIRNLLKEKCETEMARQLAENMEFKTDPVVIVKDLGSVNEMKQLITSGVQLPLFSFHDVATWMKEKRMPNSYLSSMQLYQAALTFHTMREMHDFFNREDFSGINLQNLKTLFKQIPVFENLEKEIFRCIDKDGAVKDNASPELYEIRKSIQNLDKSMHKIMRRVLDNSISQGLIDKDATPSLREGRMVIPVSSSNKRNIPGIVHDTSATGKTFFIEPAEVVEAGNRLRELHIQEEQEIITILIGITHQLQPFYEEINFGCELLADYDFIKAKAAVGIETGGEMPKIETNPEIDWFHAIHPGLLITLRSQGKEVVPMNLRLDQNNRILIISGPNAGGKSVSLKTVGTVQYMMQCGLLPTLYSNSHMGIFSNIFIDIGDEQSMENDLSTYSSHLANMKFFIRNANKHTLLLGDEIGSGTEPQIGAALAQSILESLGETGCFGVFTTHYQNLKVFAENEKGFVNGAMLYDRQHLQPTFQLSVGEPGSSFALDIARKIGLPISVIDNAKNLVGSEYVDSEKFLLDLQRDKRYWKNKRLEIKEKENRLNTLLENYESKAEELKSQRNSIIKEARREAKEILQGANSKIEQSIHEIRKAQAEREKAKAVRKELEEYKKELDKEQGIDNIPDALRPLKHSSRKKKQKFLDKKSASGDESGSLVEGDYVKMNNGAVIGKIISIQGKKAEVAFGNLRTKIDLSQLQKSKKPQESIKNTTIVTSPGNSNNESRQRQLNFKNEIDVRGMRADEALQALTYFIDDALQFNTGRVRILHGTGYGILRTLIRQQLQSSPYVKSFHDEDVRFGGAGITVVDLE